MSASIPSFQSVSHHSLASRKRAFWKLPLLLLCLAGSAQAQGPSSSKISVPKGPGSIEGLASADLAPSLATGSASYSIPIAVPPAARAFGPSLALSYHSGAGVSELAMGWSFGGLPRIQPSSFALLESITWNDFNEDSKNQVILRYEDRPDISLLPRHPANAPSASRRRRGRSGQQRMVG